MAKVAAEKNRLPSRVWTVDPLLAYPTGSQESNNGVDNAAFYDGESGLCTKLSSVKVSDPCHKKHSLWENNAANTNLCSKRQCNGRLALLLLLTFVLLVLVASISTVAYLAVGEVRLSWTDTETIQEVDEGVSIVEGHLRVTNRVFTKDLLNTNSQSYHKFTAQVKQSMDAVFLQSGLAPYYNETGVLGYMEGSVIVRCRIHLSTPRMDATHQVGMAIIQALERHHGYLPGGILQVDIRSLHFTGLIGGDDSISDNIRLPIASWSAWSEWSPCPEPCEIQTRYRICVDEHGRKYPSSVNGPCGVDGGSNREVRNCPCYPVLPTTTTTKKPAPKKVDENCAGDCEDGQICLLLSQTSVARCLVPRDVNDPTGCGGWCVGDYQLCRHLTNSTFECIDNSECANESKEWRCGNGLCIPKARRCDGQLDCYDMSDEFNCECEEGSIHCGNNTSCLPQRVRCNGQVDCWDGTDELNCTLLCPTNQYTCNNGKCVDKLRFCDGFSDCEDGSDEPEGCNAPCLHTQNQCRNGRCVNTLLWCNGVDNCGDETDEIACDPPHLLTNH